MRAYKQRELDAFASIIGYWADKWRDSSRKKMLEEGGDRGTCIMGDGIAVYLVPPRCRKPRRELIIPSHSISSCQGASHYEATQAEIVRGLQAAGLECFYHYGSMD